MYNVKKRDGKIVKFELGKIKDALAKAIEATEQPVDDDVVDFMALKVTSDFASKVKDDIIGVEDIQDSCEAV
jgi:ribonucleoside-triphosphate reductase